MIRTLPLLLLLVIFAACSDSTEPVNPDAGKTHVVHGFYAQVDQTLPVHISTNGTTVIGDMTYGTHKTGVAAVGDDVPFDIAAQSGTVLASTKVRNRDGYSTWVIYTGTGNANDAVGLSLKLDSVVTGQAGIAFINVAANSNSVTAHLETASGPQIGNSVDYKHASEAFTTIPTYTQKIAFVDKSKGSILEFPLDTVKAGNRYLVVLYGNVTSTGVNPVAAQVVQEP